MRQHSRVTAILAILLAIGILAAACQSAPSAPAEKAGAKAEPASQAKPKEPYKIGLLTTLTGPPAFVGNDIRDAAQLEVDRINAAGGIDGHLIELIVEDDGGDPSKAVTGLTKLIRQDKVLAVTGPFIGPLEAALRPVAEREQTPFVVICPTTPELRAGNHKYAFNIAPNETARVGAWLDALKTGKYTKVAGITSNDPVLFASFKLLQTEGRAQGIEVIVLPDAVDPSAIDLTPEVTKLKELVAREKSQVVVSGVWPPATPALLKTMKQLGVGIPTITYDAAADPFLFAMGGDELDGLMLPGGKVLAGEALPDGDPQKAVVVDFKKRYEGKTGRPASALAGMSYDSTNMIANALKVAGPDKAKIRDAIEKTTNFVGVTGVFTYKPNDHEGLTRESFAIYEVKDKKFVFLRVVK